MNWQEGLTQNVIRNFILQSLYICRGKEYISVYLVDSRKPIVVWQIICGSLLLCPLVC